MKNYIFNYNNLVICHSFVGVCDFKAFKKYEYTHENNIKIYVEESNILIYYINKLSKNIIT